MARPLSYRRKKPLVAAALSSRHQLSAIAAIFTVGLGTRKEGEASAYSIFNGFNELPGAFNAAQVDDQMRHRDEQAAQGPYME